MELLQGLMDSYPRVTQTLALIGTLRLFLKPLFSWLNAYVLSSASKRDDEILNRFASNIFVRALLYTIDWITSVKVRR